MTEQRKFKLKKMIEEPPQPQDHRFSSKEGGKIVVHSKRHSQPITPHTDNAEEMRQPRKKNLTRPRRKRQGRAVALGVFSAILALVGIVLLIHYYRVKQLEARTEAYLLQQARTASEEMLPAFTAPLKTLSNLVARADELMISVSETVQFVTDRPLAEFSSSLARRAAWLREQQARAASEAARAPAPPPASDADDAEPIQAPKEPETPISINGRDAPMGFETEHIRPRREPPTPPKPEQETPELPGVSVDGRDAPAGIDLHAVAGLADGAQSDTPRSHHINFDTDPEVVKLARKAISARESINTHYHELRALHQQALDLDDEIQVARLSTVARQKGEALTKLKDDAESLTTKSEGELAEMIKLTETIRRVGIDEKQKREAAAEVERQRQEAEDYKNLVAKERRRVQSSYEEIKPLIPSYDFATAVDRLRFTQSQLRTKEAKSDLEPILARISAMADTKQDMITNLTQERYRWGWGTGATAVDIIGADATTIWIPTKKIPWAEVPLPQLVKVLQHYIDRTQDKLSVRAQRELALSILFHELGMRDEAKATALKAIQLTDTIQADVERLMPNL